MSDPTGRYKADFDRNGRTALYRFYDSCGRLLYVGITRDLDARWTHHEESKPWWPQVARKEAEWYPTRLDAAIAEVDAIRSENPLHNATDRRAGLLSEYGMRQKAAAHVKSFIRNHGLAPGDRLPSPRHFADLHKPSQATFHKAMGDLEREGVVERAGRYRVVAQQLDQIPVTVGNVSRDSSGYRFGITPKGWAQIGDPSFEFSDSSRLAAALGIGADRPVLERYWCFGPTAEEPIQFVTSHLALDTVLSLERKGGMTRTGVSPEEVYDLMERALGAPLSFEESVHSRPPVVPEQRALGIPAGSTVLVVSRTARLERDGRSTTLEIRETAMPIYACSIQTAGGAHHIRR